MLLQVGRAGRRQQFCWWKPIFLFALLCRCLPKAQAAAACCHHHACNHLMFGGAVSTSSTAATTGAGGAALKFLASGTNRPSIALAFTALSRILEKRPVVVLGVSLAHRYIYRQYIEKRRIKMMMAVIHSSSRRHLSVLLSDTGDDSNKSKDSDAPAAESGEEANKDVATAGMTTAMVSSIGFYKKFISPLLPPACRFVPTCSQYGVQAIQEFGPAKGGLLTAWRIMRCSPFGGKGYDPPKWPPVFYTYSSY